MKAERGGEGAPECKWDYLSGYPLTVLSEMGMSLTLLSIGSSPLRWYKNLFCRKTCEFNV